MITFHSFLLALGVACFIYHWATEDKFFLTLDICIIVCNMVSLGLLQSS